MPGDHPRAMVVPADANPLVALAERICADQAGVLPDLSLVSVAVPHPQLAAPLRRALLRAAGKHGHGALLTPRIAPLRALAARHTPPSAREMSGYSRELLLAEALSGHPDLYGKANPWLLAEDLLRLFDELTLQSTAVPDSLADFERRLARGYGLGGAVHAALEREAALVHTLWHAWHAQMRALEAVDEHAAYLARLASMRDTLGANHVLYVAYFSPLSPAERAWVLDVTARGGAVLVFHQHDPDAGASDPAAIRDAAPATARAEFLEAVYGDSGESMFERARVFGDRHATSPVAGNIAQFAARSNEDEARAVELQVRRWLLAGMTNIGVVTEDRRLARRVRALLERADVAVDDYGGWALSTTRAATVLERWLQCVEEDFAQSPLLDVLKSPFVFPGADRATHLNCVYRFEEDVIRNENVPRNLGRYREHLRNRRQRLPGAMGANYPPVDKLLERIRHAAEPVLAVLGHRARAPEEFLASVMESAERLGLRKSWEEDAAGACILRQLAELRDAARRSRSRMRWADFRAWLGRALERSTFVPPSAGHPVHVLTLAQSAGMSFDAAVVAGCDREHLPGGGATSPFFNASVRAELGLLTEDVRLTSNRREFHRLLAATPRVVLTRVHLRGTEEVIASPWVELLITFHRRCYGDDLHDPILESLARDPATEVLRGDDAPLPPATQRPAAVIDPRLMPDRYSPDSYDRLLACPYQFFAANALRLSAPEEIREAMQKNDYGHRVHDCLQAFLFPVPGMPPPFGESVGSHNRDAAIDHLTRISKAVFRRDLEDNFQHRAWLKQWLRTIPAFIDWEIENSADWHAESAEFSAAHELQGSTVQLKGRVDRIDRGAAGLRIIDYKTGATPNLEAVQSGESTQLPVYAALLSATGARAVRAEYLQLTNEGAKSVARIETAELDRLAETTCARLSDLDRQLRAGHPAPAWGDETTCDRCAMGGLCRRAYWSELDEESSRAGDR